ncbi:MAG: hypothetical protein U0324_43905 [Polyangiales bacterium]
MTTFANVMMFAMSVTPRFQRVFASARGAPRGRHDSYARELYDEDFFPVKGGRTLSSRTLFSHGTARSRVLGGVFNRKITRKQSDDRPKQWDDLAPQCG